MKTILKIAAAVAVCGIGAKQANAQTFSGPTIGVEAAFEDYDGAEGETISIVAGWDFAFAPDWVAGIGARLTVDGIEDSQTEVVGANTATARIAIEDQWGVSARFGRLLGDRVLLFGEVGYEQFHVDASLDLSASTCAPPNSCLISSLDGSFDEDMITYGIGAEWAITDHWRLRGTYTIGDGGEFDRDRFALSAALRF